MHPLAHGVLRNGMVLPAKRRSLAESLRVAGYRTGGVVSSFILGADFGFDQGFAAFRDDFAARQFSRTADRTTDLALEWLAGLGSRRARRPFFLWVHHFDPHEPYAPPAEFLERFPPAPPGGRAERAVAAYDGEVAFADRELGRLLGGLDLLGVGEQTLVVVTADHGEGLLQHGLMGHGHHLYEEAVRVPLVLRWPGRIRPGTKLEGPVELVDVAPTLLELLGLPGLTGQVQGASLAGALRAGAALPRGGRARPVFLFQHRYDRPSAVLPAEGEKYGVRLEGWKYIVAEQEGRRELYDLAADPLERSNLALREPGQVERLAERLAVWRARTDAKSPAPVRDSPEALEGLRALGYVQ
jgi:arylsulfatase A-like enzyme